MARWTEPESTCAERRNDREGIARNAPWLAHAQPAYCGRGTGSGGQMPLHGPPITEGCSGNGHAVEGLVEVAEVAVTAEDAGSLFRLVSPCRMVVEDTPKRSPSCLKFSPSA